MKKQILLIWLFFTSLVSAQTGWVMVKTLSATVHNQYGALYAFDANHVSVMADNGKYYSSTDGGANWTLNDISINAHIYDLTFNNNLGVAVGDNGTLLLTTDTGNNWSIANTGINETLIEVAIPDNSNIWTVGLNGTLLHSADAGNTWTNMVVTTENLYAIKFRDAQTGYIAGANRTLYKTTDGGTTWNVLSFNYNDTPINDLFSLSLTPNKITLLGGDVNHYSGEFSFSGNKALASTDETNWIVIGTPTITTLCNNDAIDNTLNVFTEIAIPTCNCPWEIKVLKQSNTALPVESLVFDSDLPYPTGSLKYNSISFVDSQTGYFLSGDYVFKTTDGGTYTQLNDPTMSIPEIENTNISIYPNPSSNNINIQIDEIANKNFIIEIVDTSGKQLFKQKINQNTSIISIKNLTKGIYYIKVLNNNNSIVSKKIIKN